MASAPRNGASRPFGQLGKRRPRLAVLRVRESPAVIYCIGAVVSQCPFAVLPLVQDPVPDRPIITL